MLFFAFGKRLVVFQRQRIAFYTRSDSFLLGMQQPQAQFGFSSQGRGMQPPSQSMNWNQPMMGTAAVNPGYGGYQNPNFQQQQYGYQQQQQVNMMNQQNVMANQGNVNSAQFGYQNQGRQQPQMMQQPMNTPCIQFIGVCLILPSCLWQL